MPSISSPSSRGGSSSWHNGKVASSSSVEVVSGPEDTDSDRDSGLHSVEEDSSEELSSEEEEEEEKQRQVYKADITPHHRSEKRPQRKSAAKASDVWSQLGPGSRKKEQIIEVVIDVKKREKSGERPSRQEQGGSRSKMVPEVEVYVTPTKRSQIKSPISTPKEKEKAVEKTIEEAAVRTPTKKQKVISPRKRSLPATPTSATLKARALDRQRKEQDERYFIRPTSSDAYFANHAPRSKQKSSKHQTSDNVLSGTMPSISSKMITNLSNNISHQLLNEDVDNNVLGSTYFEDCYDYWWSLLVGTNRPLLLFGVGSKRIQLQNFARYLAKQGKCASIVIRGESGGRIEDIVRELERIVEKQSTSSDQARLYSTPLESRAHSLVKTLQYNVDEDDFNLPPSILIIIHNFDMPLLLQEKTMHILAILSVSRRIHLCVDTCHVNSGLIGQLHSEIEQSRLSWLWINMNTYVPMLEEIINERGTGISRTLGLPRVLDIRAAGGGGSDIIMIDDDYDDDDNLAERPNLLTERAAIHILRSVTEKGKKLFILLADKLLQSKGASTFTYFNLASLARDNYLATSPEALRTLLIEFTSHGLIRVEGFRNTHEQSQGLAQVSDGAMVNIALSRTDMNRIVEDFKPKS